MKVPLRLFLAAVLVLLLPAALITVTPGCAHQPAAERAAYKTLSAVATGVDTAMRVYADAVARGQVTAAQQQRVDALYRQYQDAFRLAVAAARTDLSRPAPAELAGLALELTDLITRLQTPPPQP